MDSEERDKRAANILTQLLPPHALVVLTAMSTVEKIISTRKRKMAKLVDRMTEPPSAPEKEEWQSELKELMKDYAMLTAMIVDAYETVLKLDDLPESNEDLLRRLGIDAAMLVPGPKEIQ